MLYHKIVDEFQGPKLTMDGDGFFDGWLQNITGQSKGAVRVGPSVANVAFDLAVKLGLNPIVLIGQDLAYTNGLSHASSTAYQRPIEETSSQFNEVEDVFGGKVLTDRVLSSMREWFNREIARLPAERMIINATEGGAKIEGARIMRFREVLDQYFTEEFDARGIIQNAFKKFKPLPIKKQKEIWRILNKIKKRLVKIDNICVKGIMYAERLEKLYGLPLRENEDVALILKKLDRIDRQLKEYEDDATILNLIFQPVAHSLAQSFKAGPVETGQEEGRRLARKSRFLYLGIEDAARRLWEILSPVVENLGFAREREEKKVAKSLPELPAEEHSNGFAG
jgi:hypothetical protein